MNKQIRFWAWPRLVLSLLILAGLSGPPSPLTSAQSITFGNATFREQWNYSDKSVAEGRAGRSWLWGPTSLASRVERLTGNPAYGSTPDGYHLVQYFDKGRMEFKPPANGKPGYVTNGRLVVEMMTGDIQTGVSRPQFYGIPPATTAIAGDTQDGRRHPKTPTYATLYQVATVGGGIGPRANSMSRGALFTKSLDRNGNILSISITVRNPPKADTFYTFDNPQQGHNIPDVFMRFLTQSGEVWNETSGRYETRAIFADWVAAVGFPITEPYWIQVRINDKNPQVPPKDRWVLFQAFERRILTYDPLETAPWRVQMGNVGQHYKDWRPEPLRKPDRLGALVVQASANNTAHVCPKYKDDYEKCEVPIKEPEPSVTVLEPASWAKTDATGSMMLVSQSVIYDLQASARVVFERLTNSVNSTIQSNGRVDYAHEPRQTLVVQAGPGIIETIHSRFSVVVTDTAMLGEPQLFVVVPREGGSVTLTLPSVGPSSTQRVQITVPAASELIVRQGQVGVPVPTRISPQEELYWNDKISKWTPMSELKQITGLGEVAGPALVLASFHLRYDPQRWGSYPFSDYPTSRYSSTDRSVMARQIGQAVKSGIDGFVSLWGGSSMESADLSTLLNMAIASSPLPQNEPGTRSFQVGILFNIPAMKSGGLDSLELIDGQLQRATRDFTGHASYLRWADKPVFFFRGADDYGGLESWRMLRDVIDPKRAQLWVVESTDSRWLEVFDALHLYDGGLRANNSAVPEVNQGVRQAVDQFNIDYNEKKLWVAGVVPGWNSESVDPASGLRIATEVDRADGNLYEASWCAAVSSAPDWVMVNSFNEWYEGTQIEPSVTYGDKYLELTRIHALPYKSGTSSSICEP